MCLCLCTCVCVCVSACMHTHVHMHSSYLGNLMKMPVFISHSKKLWFSWWSPGIQTIYKHPPVPVQGVLDQTWKDTKLYRTRRGSAQMSWSPLEHKVVRKRKLGGGLVVPSGERTREKQMDMEEEKWYQNRRMEPSKDNVSIFTEVWSCQCCPRTLRWQNVSIKLSV